MNKRGQVTIFIIVGVLIVTGIVLFFLLRAGFDSKKLDVSNPGSLVSKCVEENILESTEKIFSGGGRIKPLNTLNYFNVPYNYLCYTSEDFKECYNTHPLIERIIEEEIKLDTLDDVQSCFDKMREDFENRNFEVRGEATSYGVDLVRGKIKIDLDKSITVSKEKIGTRLSNFDFDVTSSLYGVLEVVRAIVLGESTLCDFDYVGYMMLDPDYEIKRIDYLSSKIYSVKDLRSGDVFKFAVRSCVVPL